MGLDQPAVQLTVGHTHAYLNRVAGNQIKAGRLEVDKSWADIIFHYVVVVLNPLPEFSPLLRQTRTRTGITLLQYVQAV